MRKLRSPLLVACVFALVATSPGFAADQPVKGKRMAVKAPPKPTAPVYPWTGFYAGGNAGFGWAADPTVSFSPIASALDLAGALIGAGAPVAFGLSGALGGVQVGYNWQVDRQWLVGLETDFDGADIKGSGTAVAYSSPIPTAPFTSAADERVEWFGTVRARLGYLPADNLLAYGTGGLAYGRVAQSVSYSNGFNNEFGEFNGLCLPFSTCYAGADAPIALGWTAGGGFEYALSDHWMAKAEYLYVNLGSNAFQETVLVPGVPGDGLSRIAVQYSDLAFQVVRLGLNYRF
jgi:outer membrane immunogenic protein